MERREFLIHLWAQVRAELDAARQSITVAPENVEAIREHYEWLDHNELELAWDALAATGEIADVAFWKHLARAAELMKLPNHQAKAEAHIHGDL